MRICITCKLPKDESEFYELRTRKKPGTFRYESRCKPCSNKRSREYQKANREKAAPVVRARQVKYGERNRKYVDDYLLSNPCVDCGESDIVVLQFDHIDRQNHRHVTYLLNTCASIKRLQEEIDKCQVRCANCHVRRHHFERQSLAHIEQ